MKIAYLSFTGNVRSFVNRVDMDSVELDMSNPFIKMDEDFIVITPSYSNELINVISEFVDYKDNIDRLVGFVGSGNKNWDISYCFVAKDLATKYNKPFIFDFELSGTENDIREFKKEVESIAIARATKES
ncbi:class Ib ribonucleoside-diphosphate reductase assembly flavoprotein NrdI [Bacillus stercoris]|uniref:class Ib ribonucleoside-diphosphate reductase assembly flavoprotein NrdI n=1 Tax=Bacillus stercoris TaxID=2054641 RepID=UPI003CEC43DF